MYYYYEIREIINGETSETKGFQYLATESRQNKFGGPWGSAQKSEHVQVREATEEDLATWQKIEE